MFVISYKYFRTNYKTFMFDKFCKPVLRVKIINKTSVKKKIHFMINKISEP